jgi:hypothetical protein
MTTAATYHGTVAGGQAATGEFRQQVLVLYLADSSLTSDVIAWALYDGTGRESAETGDNPDRPFATGLAALEAGWRLIGMSPLRAAAPDTEYVTSYLKFEFVFERLVSVGAGPVAGRPVAGRPVEGEPVGDGPV